MSKLDKEEQEILNAYQKGKVRISKDRTKEVVRLRRAAKNTLMKNRRVNIRISSKDLDDLQVKAAEEGLPYQTLMSSVLHKYVNGRLIEKKAA